MGVNVSPNSVNSEYTGQINLTITGLANGQTVVVEKFVDANGNDAADNSDLLVQSFRATDGQVTGIGGVRNSNVPGDDDGAADGQIHTALSFRLHEVDRGVGKFIYRVSPVASGFAPVAALFTVTQPSYPQKITGRVLSGSAGVAYAFVASLSIDEPHEIVAATLTDGSGNFTLNTASGLYLLAAFKSGFLFDFQNPTVVFVNAGATVTQNVSLTAAIGRTISGRVIDASSGAGIAGVQLFLESNSGLVALVFSDANGKFAAPVSTADSDWKLTVSDSSTTLLGYLEHRGTDVRTGAGDVSDVSVGLTKGTALLYGRLVDDQRRPVSGIPIRADQGQLAGNGFTDVDGNYHVVIGAGQWFVRPEEKTQAALGFVVPGVSVAPGPGQAMHVDFAARRVTAHLRGRVVDDTGAPVADAGFGASDFAGYNVYPGTDDNGSFDIGVFGGTWHLQLASDDARERGLIGPDVEIKVLDGSNLTDVTYMVRRSNAQIAGSLRDNSGQAIPDVAIYGSAVVGGQTYRVNGATDASGSFRFGVFNASWQIGVACSGLTPRGLDCVPDQSIQISGSDRVVNFVAPFIRSIHIDTQSLADGSVGVPYNAVLVASGGTMPHIWSLTPGSSSLPPGLSLSNNGVLQGIPSSSGTYAFAVRVQDANAQTADRGLSLIILRGPDSKPSLDQPERLSDGRVRLRLNRVVSGQTYTIEFSADLKSWTPLISLPATSDVVECIDALTPSLLQRFYRARVGN